MTENMNHDETVDLDAVDVTPAREVTVRSENTATERQVALINKLKEERNLDGTDARRALSVSRELWRAGIFDKRAASRLIDDLMAAPKVVVHMDYVKGAAGARASQEDVKVAAGRYALDFGPDHNGINQIRFYKVDRPTEGRWAGRVFVKRYESDEEVRISRQEQADVLSRIEKDPEALARYGQEIGRCGSCGRTLTNDESRAIGIGPECRKNKKM